jgi:two-component system sensor histidine kinase VicK
METQISNNEVKVLRELSLHFHDAVLIIDRIQNKVAFANEAASSLLEVNCGDDLEKVAAMIDSVSEADQEYVKNKYYLMRDQPATTNVEIHMRKGTDSMWFCCDAFFLAHRKYIYVVARDISRAKQHEQYLVEYGARKATLLDTLVHQINGSLMLMNNLALSATKLKVKSDQSELESFISLIHSNSKHAIDVINDLLKQEHSESPGIHVRFTRVDVVKIASYIFDELRRTVTCRRILFENTAPEIYINTDEVKLLQIINNLTSNAVKFTREQDEVKIALQETSFSVVISVADTGIGIPKALQQFIFEKYGPARRTGLNGEKSMGLGLSICNHLTNLIGGRLWFQSQEGVGSTFFLELPKG